MIVVRGHATQRHQLYTLKQTKEVYKEIHLIDGLYCKRKTREKLLLTS